MNTRVSKACDHCSRYRRRCDGNTPCQLCVEKARICLYTRVMKKRGPEAKRLEKLKSEVVELTKKVELKRNFHGLAKNEVSHWSHKDFLDIRVEDKFGRLLSMVDSYFVYTYISLPILSRHWIIDYFTDVPLHLLHSMYITALMSSNLPGNSEIALKHAKFLRKELYERLDACDPFILVSLIHLAFYEYSSQHRNSSLAHIATAIREAQMMGLDLDNTVVWKSDSTGRTLGSDFGLDKQFLRSIWFLLFLWDNNNHLMFGVPTLIGRGISNEAIISYVSPNIGDSSNIPQNFLTHNLYVMPLINLGKLATTVAHSNQCFELLGHFDNYLANMPISYLVLSPIWLGRTINWINELYHYYRFKLLVFLYFHYRSTIEKAVQEFVRIQMMASINTILMMATAFTSFFGNEKQTFGTYLFFSKVLNIAFVAYTVIEPNCTVEGRSTVLDQFLNSIKLSGTPQDYEVLEKCAVDQRFATETLADLFSHLNEVHF